ncbi:hypothetical protein GCM10009660_23280 [Catellatospora bangladeshensis]
MLARAANDKAVSHNGSLRYSAIPEQTFEKRTPTTTTDLSGEGGTMVGAGTDKNRRVGPRSCAIGSTGR